MRKLLFLSFLTLFSADNLLNADVKVSSHLSNRTFYTFDLEAKQTEGTPSLMYKNEKMGTCWSGKLYHIQASGQSSFQIRISYDKDHYIEATQKIENGNVILSLDGANLSEPILDKDKTGKWQTYWYLPDPVDASKTRKVIVEYENKYDSYSTDYDYYGFTEIYLTIKL